MFLPSLRYSMPVAALAGGSQFDPLDLSPTLWLDFQDTSKLWQDTAATSAVTSSGQSIARVDDKSGNGHNFTQATAAARPTYITTGYAHALFDGAGDVMASAASVDLTGTDAVTVVITAERTTTNTSNAIAVESSVQWFSTAGSFIVTLTDGNVSNAAVRGAAATGDATGTGGHEATLSGLATSGSPEVIVGRFDVSEDSSEIWVNNTKGTDGTAEKGTGNFGNHTIYLGGRGTAGSLGMAAKVTDLFVFPTRLSDTDRQNLQTYLAAKNGATLA